MPINIFISHASEDHDFVLELAKKMRNDLENIAEIFVDDWEIKVGDSIVDKINEAISKAEFFVIVLSPNSVNKEWVKKELDAAFAKLTNDKRHILPVWLEISKDQIPPLLLPIKAAVFNNRYPIDQEEYKKLLEPILHHEKAKNLQEFQEQVLSNIRHLDIALSNETPSPEEVNFVIELIKKYEYCEKYFFSKLDSPKWFALLKSENFFSPQKAPKPEPVKGNLWKVQRWSVLDYLERVSQKVTSPENEKYINELLKIIKDTTEYHKETKKLDNFYIWLSFIKILSNLPNEKITTEIIDLIPTWLDTNFSTHPLIIEILELAQHKFLTDHPEDTKKIEHIICHLTDPKLLKEVEPVNEIIALLVYGLTPILNHLAQNFSLESVNIFTERIKKLVSTKYDGTINSLYDYERAEYILYQPLEFLTFILVKILLAKSNSDPESIKKVLEPFFAEEHPIFTKIALFIIENKFETFKDLFWDIFEKKGELILEHSTLFWGDELKNILKKLHPLNNYQKSLLNEKIEKASQIFANSLEDTSTEIKEEKTLLFKQKIYNALSSDPDFKTHYEEVKKITKVDAELHPALGVIEPIIETSPLTPEEILNKSIEDLVDFLLKFRTESPYEGPTVEGLAKSLKSAVMTNPQKFTQNLTPFLDVGYLYTSNLLDGLTPALKENKPIAYEQVLSFAKNYIDRETFWNNDLKVPTASKNSYESFISHLCLFISETLKLSNPPEIFFEKSAQILLLILKRLETKSSPAKLQNYVSYSLNSPLSRTLETYIELISKTPEPQRNALKDNFLKTYKNLLDNQTVEAYILLGLYLPKFYYFIDRKSTLDFINTISIETESWESFITGYLYNQSFLKELYNLMKEHYKRSLNYNFKNKQVQTQLIKHISLAYLLNLESLTPPSLFYELISKLTPDVIIEIINYFYQWKHLKENTDENNQIRDKILNFWTFVYDNLKLKETLSDPEKKILSKATTLSVFLTRLSEPYISYLKNSAKFLENSDFVFLLDIFEKWSKPENKTQITDKIIAEILSNAPAFRYPEDKIKSLIKYLLETKNREVIEIAKTICEKYIKHEIFYLKEICETCISTSPP